MVEAFRVDRHKFQPARVLDAWDTISPAEARGMIWLFEPPLQKATYVVACDPAQGITGWDRNIPQDDQEHDNAAIQVWRVGSREERSIDKETGKEVTVTIPTDYQVAEYAGPVDYDEAANIINALGRYYRGNGRMGVAHTIIEVFPGPGWMVEKTLISKYGYLNFYQPKFINTIEPQAAKGIGWQASQKSVRDLWIFGTRHINMGSVVVRSPWLVSEMQTTEPIKFLQYRSEAQSSFHDDRLRAAMLAFWAGHDFSSIIRVETKTKVEPGARSRSWQASDISLDGLQDAWERRFQEISEE